MGPSGKTPGKPQRSARGGASSEARIGAGTRVRGRVTGDGDLVVDGAVEGDIVLRGSLTIGEDGSATSSVSADEVIVAGALEGDVESTGPVRVGANGRLRGDVRAAGLVLDEGAQFAGRVECDFDLPAELGR